MAKRKLDGTVDEFSADVNQTRLYITCEKSGGLHLEVPSLTAGSLADEIRARLEILKACFRSKYSIFCFV